MLAVRLALVTLLLVAPPTATAVGYVCTPAFLVCVENEERDNGTCPHGTSYEERSVRVVPVAGSASYGEAHSCYHGPNGAHDDRHAYEVQVVFQVFYAGVEWSSIDSPAYSRCDLSLDLWTVPLHPICPMGPPGSVPGALLP